MNEVTIRELRNQGAQTLNRVSRGEILTVTRDGRPVAELRPLPRRPTPAPILLARWRCLPPIDGAKFLNDIADVLDASV